jgi:flagellar biosynthesis GTPase FlhF
MAMVAVNPINLVNPVCCAEQDNECPICFHDMLFPKQVPCCNRRFHEDCLNKWYAKSPTCPNCRVKHDASVLKRIENNRNHNDHRHILQLFYNFYNREFRNAIIPETVGIDTEIDEICRKYAHLIRVEFIYRHQGKMINELAKLYKNRQAQRFIAEFEPNLVDPPKKRGRPLGSKNKPKDPLNNDVKKISRQEKEKKERENRIAMQEELNKAIAKKKEDERIANEAIAKKKEEERIANEAIANEERIRKENEANPIKMAGNAALKRAIINILDKGGYGK